MLVRNNTEYPSVLSSLVKTNPGPVCVILHFFLHCRKKEFFLISVKSLVCLTPR